MRVLTDATCIRVLNSEKIIVGIGNELMLMVRNNDATQWLSASLPRFSNKIHGIDFRKIESNAMTYWLIAFHAGRDAYSLRLNEDNTFSAPQLIQTYNPLSYLLFYPSDRSLFVHSIRRLNDWISALKFIDDSSICLITGHGVAVHLMLIDLNWSIFDICPCQDSSTLYCSQIFGTSWNDLLCFSGTALGLLVIWRPAGPLKGSILYQVKAHNGVIFSIEYSIERNFLITTSDDRSVKFWTLNSRDGLQIELKENGYCFGHTARVFQCKIICKLDSLWVVSVGEDSNICLWDELGNIVTKKRVENGATLWNLDYDEATETIFACASNGNVSKFGLRNFLLVDRGKQEMSDVSPLLLQDHLSKVKFISDDLLVAVTNRNRVILLNGCTHYGVIDQLENFKCSILEACKDRIFIAGDKFINIYARNADDSFVLQKSTEIDFNQGVFNTGEHPKYAIIRSLHFSWDSDVILCDNNGRCLVYDLNVDQLKYCYRLPQSNERWLTSVFKIDQHLLLADRSGNLHLYNDQQVDPVFKLPQLHGKLGITEICLERKSPDGYFLITSGHDSHLRSIFINASKKIIEAYGSTKMPISWIDRMDSEGEIVMGFNDSHFTICNKNQEMLFQKDCGGGHRYWDCYRMKDGRYRFVYIQHKRLKEITFLLDASENQIKVPRLDWHTKSCNTVHIVRKKESNIFISGGEDNILRINRLQPNANGLQDLPKRELYSHISSIKTIFCCKPSPDGNIIVLSAGGRAQLCLTTLDPATLRTKDELSYMLQMSDSQRSRWRTDRTASLDPETRFMCVTFVEATSTLYMGCSDGFLRVFTLSRPREGYNVNLLNEFYYGRCFLHIADLNIEGSSIIVSMATDGMICFWDAQTMTAPFYKLKHHASGINSFDVKPTDSDGRFLIATGGDDQAVAVTEFSINRVQNGGFCIKILRTRIEQGVHQAQVTGIRLAGSGMLWSTSVDQMVYLLNYGKFKEIVVIKQFRTCISDVKGLELLNDGRELFIYGCGFEFLCVHV
ncbi:WD repeat-containing protein 6 [Toxorhynchites rutilus septentrionalis]|uniref:WD repeat-containing protein 6 n=1 Tax=Toxorhynchites rutilus septentrionalis TaxID=329112 RepID=UPI0024786CBF|nr:WD repeat-containing protein 6 [Toxorhynchites rutilus septentrionalis]